MLALQQAMPVSSSTASHAASHAEIQQPLTAERVASNLQKLQQELQELRNQPPASATPGTASWRPRAQSTPRSSFFSQLNQGSGSGSVLTACTPSTAHASMMDAAYADPGAKATYAVSSLKCDWEALRARFSRGKRPEVQQQQGGLQQHQGSLQQQCSAQGPTTGPFSGAQHRRPEPLTSAPDPPCMLSSGSQTDARPLQVSAFVCVGHLRER